MSEGKLNLTNIKNNTERKACYSKISRSLVKKAEELSMLSGVDVCVIAHSPFHNIPTFWPSTPDEMENVLSRFEGLPEAERNKNMLNSESLAKQKVSNLQDQLKKLKLSNRKKEVTALMYECLAGQKKVIDFTAKDLDEMSCVINQTIKQVDARIECVSKNYQLPVLIDQDSNKKVMVTQEMPENENQNLDFDINKEVRLEEEKPDFIAFENVFNKDGVGTNSSHV